MPDVTIVIPNGHTWYWPQVAVQSLRENSVDPGAAIKRVVVVCNSPWSPAYRGITETELSVGVEVIQNDLPVRFHGSALDLALELCDTDWLFCMETDSRPLRDGWLSWYLSHVTSDRVACVGQWHHEQFVNPSATLYRVSALKEAAEFCRANKDEAFTWGPAFYNSEQLDPESLAFVRSGRMGPFSERRGWRAGTVLREAPTGQHKGPGWYEPGQWLYHWLVENDWKAVTCPVIHDMDQIPRLTSYGESREQAYFAHYWGGTRAYDHLLDDHAMDPTVVQWAPYWQARERRIWEEIIPARIREQTNALIARWGWKYAGAHWRKPETWPPFIAACEDARHV